MIRIRAYIRTGAALALLGGIGCVATKGSGVEAADVAPAPPATRIDGEFRTPDGFTIAATLELPGSATPARPAPVVVLGHELDSTRRDWDPLVPRLLAAGYGAVRVDHRGFGESTREVDSPAKLSGIARAEIGEDLLGAIDFAGRDTRADTTRLIVVGSGVSGSAAVRCARERVGVRGLVLFAGVLDADGEDFLLQHPDLPLLLVVAAGDARGVELMRQYAGRFSGPRQSLVILDPVGPGQPADWRGSAGLRADTGLADLVLHFLEGALPPGR